MGFLRCTEANATRYILPDKCAFLIGFSSTMCTKMGSWIGYLADGVLADAILIPPRPAIPPTNIRKVKGPRKNNGN